ncbi:MAG: DUF559 domain-containing protein [Calditrichaeota bacterium]|nr:DUF559 domain-containing protein [Calditrichota bacterium]
MADRYYEDIPDKNWKNARAMRSNQTPAEKALWKKIRGNQLGTKFRRQHPIGKYIVDFVSLDEKLIIEVDGDTHADDSTHAYDETRSAVLARYGFRILRIGNRLIHRSIESALDQIVEALKEPPLVPPQRRGR